MARFARHVAVPVGVALALVACGPASPVHTGPSQTPAHVGEPSPGLDEPAMGPVSAFLMGLSGIGPETEAEARRRLERSEQIITACMVEQGFAYTPQDYSGPLPWMQEDETAQPVYDSIETAAEHGYSIATSDVVPAPDGAAWVDPNADYVAGMSAAEFRAYDLALYGPGQGEAYAMGEVPYDWTKYGCYGVSDHALGIDVREWFDDSPWEPLRREIEAMWYTVDDDPRVREVERQWAACMAEAGRPGLARVRDAFESIRMADEQIWQEAYDGVVLDLSTNDYLTSPEYLTAQQTAAERRRELAEAEIEMAVADATCQKEVDYRRVVGRASLEIEQAFFDAHRADFDAWLAAVEEFEAAR